MAKKIPWKHGRVSHIHEASIVTMIVKQRQLRNLLYVCYHSSNCPWQHRRFRVLLRKHRLIRNSLTFPWIRDGTISVTTPWFVKIYQKFHVFLTIPGTFPYLSEFSVIPWIPWKFRCFVNLRKHSYDPVLMKLGQNVCHHETLGQIWNWVMSSQKQEH